jgi:hypothetical protein
MGQVPGAGKTAVSAVPRGRGDVNKRFFFEKKKQKTFDSCAIGDGQRKMLQFIKVFFRLFL